jgi:hypothetical protein
MTLKVVKEKQTFSLTSWWTCTRRNDFISFSPDSLCI